MITPTTTLRLRAPLRARIQRMAKRTRRSVSAVTQDLLEEALRMRECPLIYFADEPAGREAKVIGTGLGVWEIVRDYLARGKNPRVLKKVLPDLSDAQIKTALFYYEKYPDEVDDAIAENEALYREGIQAQASGAVQRA
jgi:uncharacterized protein (DUF433 family)